MMFLFLVLILVLFLVAGIRSDLRNREYIKAETNQFHVDMEGPFVDFDKRISLPLQIDHRRLAWLFSSPRKLSIGSGGAKAGQIYDRFAELILLSPSFQDLLITDVNAHSEKLFSAIASCKNLERVRIWGNTATVEEIALLQHLPNLKELD